MKMDALEYFTKRVIRLEKANVKLKKQKNALAKKLKYAEYRLKNQLESKKATGLKPTTLNPSVVTAMKDSYHTKPFFTDKDFETGLHPNKLNSILNNPFDELTKECVEKLTPKNDTETKTFESEPNPECDNRPEILKRDGDEVDCRYLPPLRDVADAHCKYGYDFSESFRFVSIFNKKKYESKALLNAAQFQDYFDDNLATKITGTPEEIKELKNYMIGLIPDKFKQV